jgi:hypothetical protein
VGRLRAWTTVVALGSLAVAVAAGVGAIVLLIVRP